MHKRYKFSDASFVFLFFTFIFSIGILILAKPPREFSEREGRSLAQFPKISTEAVYDGSFFSSLGDFYSDQLPFRESFGNIYSLCELSFGKRQVNGIYLCKNDILIAHQSKKNEKLLHSSIMEIENLCSKNQNAIFFCPPSQASVFNQYLPSALREKQSDINAVSNNFFYLASSDPHKYYYRTDHHWTTEGAYAAYVLLCAELGVTPFGEDFFDIQTASSEFLGSSYRRSALPKAMIDPDSILLYRYGGDEDLLVTDRTGADKNIDLYDLSSLQSFDEYRLFLGGNYGHISIESNKARERMLIIKDSFANSLIPFLALHYELEMIDPRYSSPSLVGELCENTEFDKILILCSADTLATEQSVARAVKAVKAHT